MIHKFAHMRIFSWIHENENVDIYIYIFNPAFLLSKVSLGWKIRCSGVVVRICNRNPNGVIL